MTERKETGGPAFPYSGIAGGDWEGITLRDYFAAKAMQGLSIAFDDLTAQDGAFARVSANKLVNRAYLVADAMMQARES